MRKALYLTGLFVVLFALALSQFGCDTPVSSNKQATDNVPSVNNDEENLIVTINGQEFQGEFLIYDREMKAFHLIQDPCGMTIFIEDIQTMVVEGRR